MYIIAKHTDGSRRCFRTINDASSYCMASVTNIERVLNTGEMTRFGWVFETSKHGFSNSDKEATCKVRGRFNAFWAFKGTERYYCGTIREAAELTGFNYRHIYRLIETDATSKEGWYFCYVIDKDCPPEPDPLRKSRYKGWSKKPVVITRGDEEKTFDTLLDACKELEVLLTVAIRHLRNGRPFASGWTIKLIETKEPKQ